jgi:hypothetical protein
MRLSNPLCHPELVSGSKPYKEIDPELNSG